MCGSWRRLIRCSTWLSPSSVHLFIRTTSSGKLTDDRGAAMVALNADNERRANFEILSCLLSLFFPLLSLSKGQKNWGGHRLLQCSRRRGQPQSSSPRRF